MRLVYDLRSMRWLLNLVYVLAGLAYLPVLAYQILVQDKNRRGWGERLGYLPTIQMLRSAQHDSRPARGRIWLHAVSLGEVNATPQLVEKLTRRFPDHQIVVSSTTDTGYARACRLYGRQHVFRYPLDFSWVTRRVLDRIDPELIVLVELEVWPNLVELATRRDVRVAVVNGRLTQRSARRLARLGSITRSMFGRLAWVGAQDTEIASRFEAMGVPGERVTATGSLKWDTATVTDSVDGADALADALNIDPKRPLWVCGSTGPGEEPIILDAYRSLLDDGVSLWLAIVPRKPERFDEVARLIGRRAFPCVRRSEAPDGGRPRRNCGLNDCNRQSSIVNRQFVDGGAPPRGNPAGGDEVILGDTMGELRKFYALASVVFIGRSLVSMGGSDPMEAAALGKPIIAGPHMDNFRLPVEALRARNALSVVSTADALAAEVARCCGDVEIAERAGASARAVVIDHQGATDLTVNALATLIS